MKYLLLLFLFPFLSASECGKKKEKPIAEAMADSIPVCVQKMIDDRLKETPPNPPMQVDEYVYNGKVVYLFTAPCCDQFNVLYNDSCKIICSPSGGLTGKGDGKCTDFSKTARQVKLIWKENRK